MLWLQLSTASTSEFGLSTELSEFFVYHFLLSIAIITDQEIKQTAYQNEILYITLIGNRWIRRSKLSKGDQLIGIK
jgi:hypothetical protein